MRWTSYKGWSLDLLLGGTLAMAKDQALRFSDKWLVNTQLLVLVLSQTL